MHVTLDLWSSISRKSILGIKVQYMDQEWNIRNQTIGFLHFPETKNAENLREKFKDFLTERYSISPDQVSFLAYFLLTFKKS